jgi:hypothetical protein
MLDLRGIVVCEQRSTAVTASLETVCSSPPSVRGPNPFCSPRPGIRRRSHWEHVLSGFPLKRLRPGAHSHRHIRSLAQMLRKGGSAVRTKCANRGV